MPKVSEILSKAIREARETLGSLEGRAREMKRAAALVSSALTSEKKLLVCGNGGSAADAADFCPEFACRFQQDRRPFPALNLSQGGSLITATGNDYGFEEIFARQIHAFGSAGDVLVGISTSGKSKNIRRAIEEARSRQLKTIALLGRDGGSSKGT